MAKTRIAVASEDGTGLDSRVGQHFGRCPMYTLVDVADGRVEATKTIPNPHAGSHIPGDVPRFIASTRAQVLLTGGIGHRALSYFEEFGIQVSGGHAGSVAEAVTSWLQGTAGGAQPCKGHDGEHDHHHHDAGCGRH
jgi:predicted Fe-Mo cluster-binding NifX family protein